MTVFAQIFAMFWTAFFDAVLEHLPQLYGAWTKLSTSTLKDAEQAPASVVASLDEEINNATK